MNEEFFAAIELIEKEKGIPKEYMIEKISQALITAFKRDNDGVTDNVDVVVDPVKREIAMYVKKTVVKQVENPSLEMLVEQAVAYNKKATVGDVVSIPIETKKFGRIAAQTAKQVIIQGIREAERGMVFAHFTSKEREIVTAIVNRVDPFNGGAVLDIISDGEKNEMFLSAGEQVPGEKLTEGERIKVYVVEVKKTVRGPQVLISRTHPGLVKRLFEMEVPEIHDGIIEIKSISREAGSRTKIAVASNDPNVDAIGACVGMRGARVAGIVDELRGEKIDIIKYSQDPAVYVADALSPAEVVSVTVDPDEKACSVLVPDDQISLAIGKEGQNARLAAKLTGYKIDIKPAGVMSER